jgi:ribonuclease R
MGDAVRIKVVAANLEKRQLDYHWVQTTETALSVSKATTKPKAKAKAPAKAPAKKKSK